MFICTVKFNVLCIMKKLLFLISILFFTACSSDDDNKANSETILVTKIVETYEGNGTTDTYTTYLNYDGSKLVGQTFDIPNSNAAVTYTGNLITKIEYFYNSNLAQEVLYAYDSSERLINFKRYEYGGSNDFGVNVDYVYNSDGTVSYEKESGNLPTLNPSSTGVINFNTDGSVSTIVASNGYTYTYTYDTKNSPFKNIMGIDKLIFEDDEASNFILHNFLTRIEDSGFSTTTTNYSYTYNSNNYPTQLLQDDGSSIKTKQYFYNQ